MKYENYTVAELCAAAKKRGLKGYSQLKKKDLIKLLRGSKSYASPPSSPRRRRSPSPRRRQPSPPPAPGLGTKSLVQRLDPLEMDLPPGAPLYDVETKHYPTLKEMRRKK